MDYVLSINLARQNHLFVSWLLVELWSTANAARSCVGTGRCGTTFLAQLGEHEPEVASSHERLRLGATFHMFCKWHGIAIDSEGFLLDREEAIRCDLTEHRGEESRARSPLQDEDSARLPRDVCAVPTGTQPMAAEPS